MRRPTSDTNQGYYPVSKWDHDFSSMWAMQQFFKLAWAPTLEELLVGRKSTFWIFFGVWVSNDEKLLETHVKRWKTTGNLCKTMNNYWKPMNDERQMKKNKKAHREQSMCHLT